MARRRKVEGRIKAPHTSSRHDAVHIISISLERWDSDATGDAYSEANTPTRWTWRREWICRGFSHAVALRAAALGQLGRHEAAQKALRELLTLGPDFANSVRRDYEKLWDSKTIDHLIEGLRKAGLELPWSG